MKLTDTVYWGDLVRRSFEDHIQWLPRWVVEESGVYYWRYSVHRYPFVPGYHLVHYPDDDPDNDNCNVISTHKTLAEAMSILKVLLANGGVVISTHKTLAEAMSILKVLLANGGVVYIDE